MVNFELIGLSIPSNNTYYRKFRNIMTISEKGKKFKKDFLQEINKLNIKKTTGKVKVTIEFYFKDKRKRDLDNYFKCLLDCMKNVVIEDDELIYELNSKKFIGFGENKIKISIEEMN